MRNTVLSSVRQSVCSARFWLGAVFIAAVLFLTSMDAVTEALRAGRTDVEGLVAQVEEDYRKTTETIAAFQAGL